ncbi:DUF6168 family protein [Hyunsoonleella pacifica]
MSYCTHSYCIETNVIEFRFNLLQPYMFFAIFSFGLCIVFKVLSSFKKISFQLGFIYLFTLAIKVGLFAIIFNESILQLPNLSKIESLNLLIPLFIFLVLELYFVARLLGVERPNSIS